MLSILVPLVGEPAGRGSRLVIVAGVVAWPMRGCMLALHVVSGEHPIDDGAAIDPVLPMKRHPIMGVCGTLRGRGFGANGAPRGGQPWAICPSCPYVPLIRPSGSVPFDGLPRFI